MSIRIPFTRAGAIGLAGLVLLFGAAQPAAAKQDWLGWLEEFSGPGPFQGFELSVEFACLNVSHKDTVTTGALFAAYPELQATRQKSRNSLQALATALDGFGSRSSEDFRNEILTTRKGTDAQIDRLLAAVQTEILARAIAVEGRASTLPATAQTAVNDWNAYRRATVQGYQFVQAGFAGAQLTPPAAGTPEKAAVITPLESKSTSHFKTVGRRSCWGAKPMLDLDRDADRTGTLERIGDIWGRQPADAELYGSGRRDWQTGFVINAGWFWSEQNRLFDPDGTRDDATEPRLRVIPLEFLAHQKLAPAIDIGAGLGVALFSTDFKEFPERPTKPAAFYLVPLSVVVRPAKLFTDKRWAAALGYRVSLRYFGDLEGKDFGRPPSDLAPGERYFKQNGEFVWGAAMFFDLWSAAGR